MSHSGSGHSAPIRGLTLKALSQPQGRFGRMFPSLAAATYGATEAESEQNLAVLAAAMSAPAVAPRDMPVAEESGIPALYTYLGQFIDHDITFDPASTLQQQSDPDALSDFRTPAFDLDSVYGRGPRDQPYMYSSPDTLLLGDPLQSGSPGTADLPRNTADPRRAIIGDPRNDENVMVSQLHGLFLRFHNRTVADNPGLSLPDAQKLARFHYQYVVVNDFLPRIVHSTVLHALRTAGHYDRRKLRFFHWRVAPYMPVEFSVAAYRMGHSMVRPGYRLNDGILLPIFPTPTPPYGHLGEGLTGFRAMNPAWGIDWARFIDIEIRNYDGTPEDQQRRLQFSYKIDTSLENPLANLPPIVAVNPSVLAERNLLRSLRLGLPSGQDVARAMHVVPLDDSDILLGPGVDTPGSPLPDIRTVSPVFANNCPLWTYILAEAMHHTEAVKIPVVEDVTINTPRLGPVGGRIVAEVLLGLLFGDPRSLLTLDPKWQPSAGANYALKDFVAYALGN